MENPSPQPQYFSLTETPPELPKPWFRRPEMIKRIGMGGGVLLLLIFGGIFTKNLLKNTPGPQNELEATRAEVVQRQAECEPSDTACMARAQAEVARASGIAAACAGLDTDMQENCVTLVAIEKKDRTLCDELEKTLQETCSDAVLLARAAEGEHRDLCKDVVDELKRSSCEALITAMARSLGDCEAYGVDQEVCDAQENIVLLLAEGNYPGCAELAEEERIQCMELFSSTDADKDGLTAQEESELGTSDASADTDGDGYSDRQEIESGYNPLN